MNKGEAEQHEQAGGWSYTPELQTSGPDDASDQSYAQQEAINWSASEYVAHDKTSSWYLTVASSLVALSILIFFITSRSYVSAILVMAAGAIFMVSASRPPRTLEYSVGPQGLSIGGKLYTYDKFKSFSVIFEDALHSVALQPLERFMPSITIYYDPKDEDKIIDALSVYLPYEQRQLSPVDNFMKKIRF